MCVQEKSHVIISHVPSQDKRTWLLWNAWPTLPIGQSCSYSPICKRLTSFQTSIFLRYNGSCGKVLPFVARKWAARRRLGDRMGTARCTRREIMAKGTWRGVGISSRRYYRPRILTVRAIESLLCPESRSFGDDNAELRPQSGLSFNVERYIRPVRIW